MIVLKVRELNRPDLTAADRGLSTDATQGSTE